MHRTIVCLVLSMCTIRTESHSSQGRSSVEFVYVCTGMFGAICMYYDSCIVAIQLLLHYIVWLLRAQAPLYIAMYSSNVNA